MSDAANISHLMRKVMEQEAKIQELEEKVRSSMMIAERAEEYSRQDCLILRGTKRVPIATQLKLGVPFRDEVVRLLWDHTQVVLKPWSINTAHWLSYGKSIIIRFNDKEARNLIYSKRVPKNRERKGNLIIHECLSKSKSDLVNRLATLKNQKVIHSYWTQNGQVYIKGGLKTPRIHVVPEWSDEQIRDKVAHQPATYSDAAQSQVTTNYAETSVKSCDVGHSANTHTHIQTGVREVGISHVALDQRGNHVTPSATRELKRHLHGRDVQASNGENAGTNGESKLNTPTSVNMALNNSTSTSSERGHKTDHKPGSPDSVTHPVTEAQSPSSDTDSQHDALHTPPSNATESTVPSRKTPSPQSAKKQKRSMRRKARF